MSSVDDIRAALVGNTVERIERTLNGYEFIFADGATIRFSDYWLTLDVAPKATERTQKPGGSGRGEG